ncbi:Stk1 family PASTA domain-containing Ser/Thr kinase [uncultured Clostridium sp.]|uniref:Stk1 family PASTA domain-containing Ser/Thr kinase n=1 Tax=uncultured Clostridium sp. TaxID=59620 RepID=UPI0025F322C5|nr:Stk1 family PASTA domain-containing Ser/Thr kinase [uncultured Clostridium sp.]
MNGIVLGNRYELLEKIGEGGMSEVFKARCNKLNRFVAVKILKKEFCNNPEIVEKFKGEATAIAALSDNNIVNILDVGTQDDINYIVMEYVKGKTLKDVIKQVGKMNYETGISVAIQIARALDCAHRNKIIHRDVKPQNILVTEDGVMKVTDFGIAKSSTSSTITNTSTIMGSAHYLSPEQAKGSFIDCRTDLYSLGVVLYEMVTGTVPFQADSAVTIALKHIQEEVVPPKKLNSKIPDSLNKLILKAMEKEPSKRYQSAKEMIADLQKIKDNPNARIDDDDDDNEHTIIMSAVTEEIAKQNDIKKNDAVSVDDDYDDDYDDDDYDDYDDDDEDEKPKSKKKGSKNNLKKIGIGIACAVMVILLGTGIYGLAGMLGSGKEVEVPNLKGMDVDTARNTLEKLNLILVEAGEETSEEYPEGTIMQMNPEAGNKVKENTQVRVIVSGGENKLKMPDVTEYDFNKAKDMLEKLGITNIETVEDYSDNVNKGEIISQTPAKDTEISKDDKVTLVISKGAKIKYINVPSVVGLSESAAKEKLSNNGVYNISTQTGKTDDISKNGTVISQSDSGNVKLGVTITLTIGQYEEPVKQGNTNSESDTNTNTNTNTNINKPNNNSNTSQQNPNNNNNSNNNDNNSNNSSGPNAGNNENKQPEGPWDEENVPTSAEPEKAPSEE